MRCKQREKCVTINIFAFVLRRIAFRFHSGESQLASLQGSVVARARRPTFVGLLCICSIVEAQATVPNERKLEKRRGVAHWDIFAIFKTLEKNPCSLHMTIDY